MELTINGQVYQFKFGFGFIKEINKQVSNKGANGIQQEVGFETALAGMLDGDIQALTNILTVANKGQDPRVTESLLESYIEDPNTDIDALFDEVLDFLKKSNVSKKKTNMFMKRLEKMGILEQ